MTVPTKDEQATAWELRRSWWSRSDVRLTLTERCLIRTIVGKVSAVAVTGAFVTVDGWHIPTVEIRGVSRPTLGDRERYAREMRRLREGGILGDDEDEAA